MSRTMSLRGSFEIADNAFMADHELFRYEANDLTKGWEVVGAYIWPTTTRASIGAAAGQFQAVASLATDTGNRGVADTICTAADNRQIAWIQSGYQMRNSAVSDFLANSGNSPNPAAFVIDPEHIIANGLWLNFGTTSDSTTSPTREWSYMIILKTKKLDPKETILHLIKNVAQDIVN